VQSWVWRQLRVELPDEWELLQFTRNPQMGRCAFADRTQFRFEINWREVPNAPDFERMLSDYRSRLDEDGIQETRRIQCGGWQGVYGVMPDRRVTSRYGAYLAPLGCLVEVVFLWPKSRHEPTEAQVLASVRPEEPTPAGQIRWRAFGLDLLTPVSSFLERCHADPGFAQFCFSSERRRMWEHFARRGLVPHWLHEPVSAWLRRSTPGGFRTIFEREQDNRGHSVAVTRAERKIPRLPDLLLGRREYAAAAWICPRDGRLYQLSREAYRSPERRRKAKPPGVLSCCPDLEVTL
jgi:hypothetical protein